MERLLNQRHADSCVNGVSGQTPEGGKGQDLCSEIESLDHPKVMMAQRTGLLGQCPVRLMPKRNWMKI